MHWKIKRDPYYSGLYKALGEKGIIDAGFFYDNAKMDFDIRASLAIKCTPLDNIRKMLGWPKPAIVVTTGSFSPVHDGHIDMLEAGRRAVEAAGYTCVGGFLSPDHDDYISEKLGKQALPIHKRVKLIQEAVQNISWINVDPWAGMFHVTSVNFTDIVHRLKLYVKKYIGKDIPIFYVCGSDNARFAKAFVKNGHAVIVNRPGYDDSTNEALIECEAMRIKLGVMDSSNILTATNTNGNSSTMMRKSFVYPLDKRSLTLRVDENTPQELIDMLRTEFVDVTLIDVNTQVAEFREEHTESNIISMDPFVDGGYNFKISRLYDTFGLQWLGHTNRPGSRSIKEQANSIPEGDYYLFDDDIVTGKSMKFAEKILATANVNIISYLSFIRSYDHMEVLDARDFILGANEGGLVIRDVDGVEKRVPYIYPFVCPYVRASIQDPMKFSMKIWKLNYEYHLSKGNKQLSKQSLVYFTMLGKATSNACD